MKLLLINPNTSQAITDRLARSAQAVLGPADTLTAVTATEGPQAVRDAAQLAQAQCSALALADAHGADHDAIVLGISLDSAVMSLRARRPGLPIVGMTEAALLTAALCVERIGLLTLGPALLPLYRERVAAIGMASRVVGYAAPDIAAAFSRSALPIDPAVLDVLADSCERLCSDTDVQAVVLAGAVLCGYAPALTERCRVPVLDGVTCATLQCRTLLAWRMHCI